MRVHCASGFRASVAASLIARAGRDVVLIDDDWGQGRQLACQDNRSVRGSLVIDVVLVGGTGGNFDEEERRPRG